MGERVPDGLTRKQARLAGVFRKMLCEKHQLDEGLLDSIARAAKDVHATAELIRGLVAEAVETELALLPEDERAEMVDAVVGRPRAGNDRKDKDNGMYG